MPNIRDDVNSVLGNFSRQAKLRAYRARSEAARIKEEHTRLAVSESYSMESPDSGHPDAQGPSRHTLTERWNAENKAIMKSKIAKAEAEAARWDQIAIEASNGYLLLHKPDADPDVQTFTTALQMEHGELISLASGHGRVIEQPLTSTTTTEPAAPSGNS